MGRLKEARPVGLCEGTGAEKGERESSQVNRCDRGDAAGQQLKAERLGKQGARHGT